MLFSMCGLSLENDVKISTFSIHSEISNLLTNKSLIPFELAFEHKKCNYAEYRVDGDPGNSLEFTLRTRCDLIERMTYFLSNLLYDSICLTSVPCVAFLVIKKSIVVPTYEFDEWRAWWREQITSRSRVFLGEYDNAIGRLRTQEELLQEAIMKSTGKLSIEALENVVFDDSSKPCAVCLEELSPGLTGIKMPCLHEFHKNCIVRWLKTSHMCPLCRYILPTA